MPPVDRRSRRKEKRARRTRLLIGLSLPLGLLAPPLAGKLGYLLGSLWGRWIRGKTTLEEAQLASAFNKEQHDPWVQDTLQEMYRDLGRKTMETVSYLRRPYPLSELVEDNGFAYTWSRLLRQGRGLISISGHLGQWELAAAYVAHVQGEDMFVIGREAHDPVLDSFIERWRAFHGVISIKQKNSVRKLLGVLKKGKALGALTDQDIKEIAGRFIPFFGKPAWTPSTLAALSRKTGAPMLPLACLWTGKAYRMEYLSPIYPRMDEKDKEKEELRLCLAMNLALETLIKKAPEQWAWFHKRWASTPESIKAHKDRILLEEKINR